MPTQPTAITPSTRYSAVGNTRCYYIPAIAVTSAPTRAEITAGTSRDLTNEIADWTGWSVVGSQIATPDLSTLFESQIPGKITAPASTIVFYRSKTGVDVNAILPRTTTGFIMFMDGGDIAGNLAEVYPVTVTSLGVQRDAKGATADRIAISFAITRIPAQQVTIPA